MSWLTLSRTIPIAIFTILARSSYALWESHAPFIKRGGVSGKHNICAWRQPAGGFVTDERIWKNLDKEVFRDAGFTIWPHALYSSFRIADFPSLSGFGYAIPSRGKDGVESLCQFEHTNTLSRAARTRDGLDVIIRVIVIGNEGLDHLKILRTIATGEKSLISTNHALPMFMELQFDDIVFGIFPKPGADMMYAFNFSPKNSVGDVIDMFMQMLEALEFIHDLNIAHRDEFTDNFVIQWHPESLHTMKVSVSRPRVYLINFDTAVQFPTGCPITDRVSVGCPVAGRYFRPRAPELESGKAYSPFKLDVWQLGKCFSNFKSTLPAIDEFMASMTDVDPVNRFDAKEAKDRLGTIFYSIVPESLLIKPEELPRSDLLF